LLELPNCSLLSEREWLVVEKDLILQQKQWLDKQVEVEALIVDKIRSCSRSHVKNLEDSTKLRIMSNVHRCQSKVSCWETCWCHPWQLKHMGVYVEIIYTVGNVKKSRHLIPAMMLWTSVIDLGSGQSNSSRIEMLWKGIEDDNNGKLIMGVDGLLQSTISR
jgi:hypothetical protein